MHFIQTFEGAVSRTWFHFRASPVSRLHFDATFAETAISNLRLGMRFLRKIVRSNHRTKTSVTSSSVAFPIFKLWPPSSSSSFGGFESKLMTQTTNDTRRCSSIQEPFLLRNWCLFQSIIWDESIWRLPNFRDPLSSFVTDLQSSRHYKASEETDLHEVW